MLLQRLAEQLGVVAKETRVANGRGWAAGLAAADLARLDTAEHLTR